MLGAKTAAQLTKEIGYPTSNVKALELLPAGNYSRSSNLSNARSIAKIVIAR